MKSWSDWRQKCPLRKLFELDLPGKVRQMAAKNFVKALEKQRPVSRNWLLADAGWRAMEDFNGLRVWTKAHELTLLRKRTGTFPKEEMYRFTSQLRRAFSSIGANIAEGCGRGPDAR